MKKNVKWLKDAIIYHVLVDRFSRGKELDKKRRPKLSEKYMGGNLKGITDHISYLKKLGINCIWVSPIFDSLSYHGYDIINLSEVNKHFGDKGQLKKLVKIAHENEIKIILDFVPNHFSFKHPFFLEAQQNKNSKYCNWFIFKKWPKKYFTFSNVKELPKINADFPEARDYIISQAIYWIEKLDIDGFRLDHAVGPSFSFWRYFVSKIKAIKKDFALIGEVWGKWDGKKWIWKRDKYLKEFEGILDGCIDFTLCEYVRKFFGEQKVSTKTFDKKLHEHVKKFNPNFILLSLLDNHDMNRFTWKVKNDMGKLICAVAFQFTLSQPPIIYYGDEIALKQKKDVHREPSSSYKEQRLAKKVSDVYVREMMLWRDNARDEVFKFYRKLCAIRKKFVCLRKGKHITTFKNKNVYAFFKKYKKEILLVTLNNSKKKNKISLNFKTSYPRTLKDLLSDKKFKVENNKVNLILRPYSVLILKPLH